MSAPVARAAFFFGSGISRLSGAPFVDDITASLLNTAWMPDTAERFYPRPAADGTTSVGVALRAQEFLRAVQRHIEPLVAARESRAVHYEDLYAVALQIFQDETREIPNPLIAEGLAAIKQATAALHEGQDDHVAGNPFASLADRAINLIQWAVYYGLAAAKGPKGMEVISDVARAVGNLDVFSLNHDRLIEAQLKAKGVEFADGFGEQRDGYRIFNSAWCRDALAVRLLKLHGSVNWYLCRFKEWDQFAAFDQDAWHCKDLDGRWVDPLDVKPMFLSGTTVKEQAYGVGLFGDIFTEFRDLLSRHRTLVCCGYGWGDKGINIRLNQWLRNAPENKIVILHHGPLEEITRRRFWGFRWADYVATGKVQVVPKWLSECRLVDMEPFFDR
jgi:hypothetical protein